MAQDTFDVAKQTLPGGNVNKPASGSYGDVKNLDDLQKSFPTAPNQPGGRAEGPSPMPLPPSGGGVSTPPSSGLPSELMTPTARPGTPVNTALAAPPVNPVAAAATARQRNMAILDSIRADPNVSEVTRQWAEDRVQDLLRGASR